MGKDRTLVRESENAGQLDLLAGSGLMLARTAMATSTEKRPSSVSAVADLASAIGALTDELGNHAARQRAADRALRAAGLAPSAAQASLSHSLAQIVAIDIMVFAGVPADEAADAARDVRSELRVRDLPPAARRNRLVPRRWRAGR